MGSNGGLGGDSGPGSAQEEALISDMGWIDSSANVGKVPAVALGPLEPRASHPGAGNYQHAAPQLDLLVKINELYSTGSNSTQDVEKSSPVQDRLGLPVEVNELHGPKSDSARYAEGSTPVRDWLELLANVDELPNAESDLAQHVEASAPGWDWIELLAKVDDLPDNEFNLQSDELHTSADGGEPDQPGLDLVNGSETSLNDCNIGGTTHRATDLVSGRAGIEFPVDTPTVQWSTGLVTALPFSGSHEVRRTGLNNSALESDLEIRTRMQSSIWLSVLMQLAL